MSKNISIQEGGTAVQMTVDKLKTSLAGGGTCLWVPESEVALTAKSINKNGTFKASDDGYYGFSQVTVSGVGKTTGHDPVTGIEYTYTTDDQGEITRTETSDLLDLGPITSIDCNSAGVASSEEYIVYYSFDTGTGQYTTVLRSQDYAIHVWASEAAGAIGKEEGMPSGGHSGEPFVSNSPLSSTFSYNGKTVYYYVEVGVQWGKPITYCSPVCNGGGYVGMNTGTSWAGALAWKMIFDHENTENYGGATGGGGSTDGGGGDGRND